MLTISSSSHERDFSSNSEVTEHNQIEENIVTAKNGLVINRGKCNIEISKKVKNWTRLLL